MATYLPIYNQRVAVPPAQATDLHRPRPASRDLDGILCLKTTRVVRRDWTVAHHGQLYQIRDKVRATHVQVEERGDGTTRLTHNGQPAHGSRHPCAAPQGGGAGDAQAAAATRQAPSGSSMKWRRDVRR